MKIQMISCAALAASLPIFPAAAQVSQAAPEARTGTKDAPATSSTAADAPAASAPPAARGGGSIVITGRRLDVARDSITPSLGASSTRLIVRRWRSSRAGPTSRSTSRCFRRRGRPRQLRRNPRPQRACEPAVPPERRNRARKHQRVRHDLRPTDRKLDPAHHRYPAGAVRLPHSGVINFKTQSGLSRERRRGWCLRRKLRLVEPSAMIRGTSGDFSYFLSGSYLRNDLGIENPLPTHNAIHDRTTQIRPFAYISDILSDTSRISLFGGSFIGHFEIPNVTGVGGRLRRQRRRQLRCGEARPEPARNHPLRRAHLSICRRHAELPDRAVRPLFADQVHDRSEPGRRHHQRFRRRRAAVEPRRGRAGRWQLRSAAITRALRPVLPERAHTSTLSPRCFLRTIAPPIRTASSSRRATFRSRSPTGRQDRPALRRLSPGRVEADADADAQLRRALRRGARLSPRSSSSARAPTRLERDAVHDFPPRLCAQLHAAAAGIDRAADAGAVRRHDQTDADPHRRSGARRSARIISMPASSSASAAASRSALDAYYKIKRNLLDEGQFGSSLVLSPFNYAKGYAWGVELSANYTHGPIDLYANVARGEEKGKDIISGQYFFAPDELAYIREPLHLHRPFAELDGVGRRQLHDPRRHRHARPDGGLPLGDGPPNGRSRRDRSQRRQAALLFGCSMPASRRISTAPAR